MSSEQLPSRMSNISEPLKSSSVSYLFEGKRTTHHAIDSLLNEIPQTDRPASKIFPEQKRHLAFLMEHSFNQKSLAAVMANPNFYCPKNIATIITAISKNPYQYLISENHGNFLPATDLINAIQSYTLETKIFLYLFSDTLTESPLIVDMMRIAVLASQGISASLRTKPPNATDYKISSSIYTPSLSKT